jgi:hypothetical protein
MENMDNTVANGNKDNTINPLVKYAIPASAQLILPKTLEALLFVTALQSVFVDK